MPNLLSIQAEYVGPPVMIYKSFKQSDIRVTAIYDDSSYNFIVPNSRITVSTLKVETTPMQSCTVKYIDPETRVPYLASIEIPVIYPVKLTATYTGGYIYIIGEFDHGDVDVYIEYNYPEYNTKLDTTEYKINSYTVAKLGINEFIVTEKILQANNISTTITVYGIRKIVLIRANYIGDSIEITEEFDPNNIKVEIETVNQFDEDRFTVELKYNADMLQFNGENFTCDYYIKEPLTVDVVGDNYKTLCYKDPLVEWEKKIIIPGIPKVVDFETTYIGEKVFEDAIIQPEDVEAVVTLLIDATAGTKIVQTVDYGEWEFYDAPIVQDFTKGMIKTKCRDLMSFIMVPYEVVEILRLRCWYEGAKIKVGNRFRREDVFAYTVDDRHHVTVLSQYDLIFVDDQVIEKEGWNFYRIRAKESGITGVYAVPGYIPLYKEDKRPFQVLYIDVDNNYAEHDYTSIFREAMSMDGVLYLSWEVFQEVVEKYKLYGLYILTAPRAQGLSNKYDEDWEVLCLQKHTLKATVIKTYYEEDETWQNRNHQKQTLRNWWTIPLQGGE